MKFFIIIWFRPLKIFFVFCKMVLSVQYLMESMIPELEEYRKYEVFSEEEVREIVESRKRFEYRLQRHIVKTEDYMRYVHSELSLEITRKKRASAQSKNTTICTYTCLFLL